MPPAASEESIAQAFLPDESEDGLEPPDPAREVPQRKVRKQQDPEPRDLEQDDEEEEDGPPKVVHLQCPQCTSDDVKRSRRKFWERFVLPLLKAQVYRCRDCRHRWWAGVEWGLIILLGFSALVVIGVAVGMVAAHKSAEEAATAPPPAPIRRPRRKVQPLPVGLPPLSSVPRPDATGVPAAKPTPSQE